MKTIAYLFFLYEIIVALLSILFFPNSRDSLIRLSNSCDMVKRTMLVHHCNNRKMERNITARRNAFLEIANVQQCQADSIVVIELETEFSGTVVFHAYCNDSSGSPRFLHHYKVSVIIPPRLNYRKLMRIYDANMNPNVRDQSSHSSLQELASVAFSTGGDSLKLGSQFKAKTNTTGGYQKLYLWLVVRERNNYKTACYCRFLGEML